MKRREDDVDLEIDIRSAKRTNESEISREIQQFTQNYFSSRGYLLQHHLNAHHQFPNGIYFSVSSFTVKTREARQTLINIFNLYIFHVGEDGGTLLVSHLDWPTTPGLLYGFIPAPRFPSSRIHSIELMDSMSECI